VDRDQLVEAGHVVTDAATVAVSAIPLVGGPIATAAQAVENRSQRRAVRFLEDVVGSHGVRIDALEAATADERLGDLVDHGVRAASTAWAQEKMELLAGIVAAGLQPGTSGAQVDRAHLLLTLVQSLEAVHIRALMVIGLPRQGVGQLAAQRVTGGVSNDELLGRLPELNGVLDPVLATLEAQGLIA
jgi:hypothetical protein